MDFQLLKIFIGVWLIYSVVFIPAPQQNESYIYMCICIYMPTLFLDFFPHIGHYGVFE